MCAKKLQKPYFDHLKLVGKQANNINSKLKHTEAQKFKFYRRDFQINL